MTAKSLNLHSIRTAKTDTAPSSQASSPAKSSQPETPFGPASLSTADRSLLVRVLNRNLLQQREESSLQSLNSDPLLTSLPAGSPLSYPNSATARMLPDQTWSNLSPIAAENPDNLEDRSPTTPAAALLASCDSPTSVLLHAAGNYRPDAVVPPPPTPASYSEPCTPINDSIQQLSKSCSASNLQATQTYETISRYQHTLQTAAKDGFIHNTEGL